MLTGQRLLVTPLIYISAISLLIGNYFSQALHAQTAQDGEILALLIKSAKEQGQMELRLDAPIIMETGLKTVDELSSEYNWLRFHVVDIWVTVKRNHIGTWYKVRIDEPVKWQGFSASSKPPAGSLPGRLGIDPKNEGLIFQPGGELVIDGITIRQPLSNSGFRLQMNKSYLGSFYNDSDSLLLSPAAGIASLFEVKDGLITAVGPTDHPIAKSMRSIYANDYRAFVSDVTTKVRPLKP